MSILVIGGDRLGNIDKNLKGLGFTRIEHVDGRKKRHSQLNISNQMDAVLVLTDFVSHNLCKMVKDQAKDMGVKTFFSKRSWSDISKTMAR
ncbi:hypothetical protein BHU72_07100 [Desulfuribacillus stibiiarsenatis]|uniref:Dihydroorotate dehydrogenase n=1 Tax=Desulfuribacillus stibiiarsenatis TaxID=1390249 RepID=A0A1E5L495_9FIRM|nr:DUF2325 domain-containing protein [Desulfuribacillus stibiiarsenatis]OEH84952.1 hypothetical protein BHU72_07100 [Desulfuribacillus stibiiarsenatis]